MTKSKANRGSRARQWLERLLLAGGLGALAVWGGSKVVPALWQAWQGREFDRAVSSGVRPDASHRSLENGRVLGRLSIPRLHLSSIVREGDDEGTLSLAVGHIPSTALPGQTGNVGLAGHRDTTFRPLQGIHKNDLIRLETLGGIHEYAVDATRIVKPDDLSVLDPSSTSELTLVTCYPFHYIGAAPERFIVSAHEVVAATPQQASLRSVRQDPPAARQAQTSGRTSTFEVRKGHGERVAPGVSVGLTDIDPQSGRVYGWIWVTPDRRTILLRDQAAGEPIVFSQDGYRREVRIIAVSASSIIGRFDSSID